ncbi:MAG: hypothetical protein JO339_07100, partial [Alphaproteobacteria bacterium]|nr:hypothetical protein [Alphaproteobacteria bacterium]
MATRPRLTLTTPAGVSFLEGADAIIPGVSLSAPGSLLGALFTVTVSDTNGVLTAGGQSGISLDLSGTLGQINKDLAGLHDTEGAAGVQSGDTIVIAASDQFGDTAFASIGVFVNALQPVLTAPGGVSFLEGTHAIIPGVSLSEPGSQPGALFTVAVSDTNGVLTAGGQSGTTLHLSGTLGHINSELAGLHDTEGAAGVQSGDTIDITAVDSFGNSTTADIGVFVNALQPTLATPGGVSFLEGTDAIIPGVSLSEPGSLP